MGNRSQPTVLSLFTGIGLHDLGLQRAGFRIAGQCEIDEFCTKILARHWSDIPRWSDVKDVTAASVMERMGGLPTLVTGGFPCQQISCAGTGEGLGSEDDPTTKSGLWWQMKRIIDGLRPPWVIAENVPALKSRGADVVISSLEKMGYHCWPLVVGCWAARAPHSRNRVWLVATNLRMGKDVSIDLPPFPEYRWPMGQGHEQWEWEYPRTVRTNRKGDAGLRRGQIKALGNANPPQVPEALGRALLACMEAQGEAAVEVKKVDPTELVFTPPIDDESRDGRDCGWALRAMLKGQLPVKGKWKKDKTPEHRDWWVFVPSVRSKGSWHTPRAIYGEHPGITSTTHLPGQAIKWATPRASDADHGGPNQRDSAGNYALPAQVAHPELWPTPRASEHKDCGPKGSKSQKHMLGKRYLCATVSEIEDHKPSEGTFKLSAAWEAQLMGTPEGWLDLGPQGVVEGGK